MPHFDPTITLGSLLSFFGIGVGFWITAAKLYAGLDKRLAVFETALNNHAIALAKTETAIDRRMERQDVQLASMLADINRILGRLEARGEHMKRVD